MIYLIEVYNPSGNVMERVSYTLDLNQFLDLLSAAKYIKTISGKFININYVVSVQLDSSTSD